jgi:hypothetical protein
VRAFKTETHTEAKLHSDFLHNGSQPVVTLSGNFTENVSFSAAPPGAGVVFWNGSAPGSYIVNQVGGVCWILGDGVVMECTNVSWEGNGVTSTAIQMHQTAILDILSGCTFGNMNGGDHISTDGAGWSLNFDAGYTIENGGNANTHWNGNGNGIITVTGGITITINGGPASVTTRWVNLSGPVLCNMGSGITFVGTPATGAQQWAVGPQAWLSTSGNTIPGSVSGVPGGGASPTGGTGWVS